MKDFFPQKSETQCTIEIFRILQILFNSLILNHCLKFLGAPLAAPEIHHRTGFEGSVLTGELI